MNDQIKKLFGRYLEGKATPEERKLVEEWFENARIDTGMSPLDDAIKKRVIKEELFSRIAEDTKDPKIRRLSRGWGIAATVAIFLLVGFGAIYLAQWRSHHPVDYVTISAKQGEMKQVILPDGSEIWLNALSTLRYPETFGPERREVELLEGNAFFEIQRDIRKPFLVHTSGTVTKVLGTSFDIKAYTALPDVSVTVNTGKVEVSGEGKQLAILTAGEQINVDTTNWTTQRTTNAQFTEWCRGIITLENASFKELALLLRNMYGLELKALTPAINRFTYTIQFGKDDPVEQTLLIIAQMHNLDMERRGNEVVLR